MKFSGDDRAVSELISIILMIAITVGAFSVIAVSIYSFLQTPPSKHADFQAEKIGDELVIYHTGGEELSGDDIIIFEAGSIKIERTINDCLAGNGCYFYDVNDDGKWNLGEKIVFKTSGYENVGVMIISEEANQVLFSMPAEALPEKDLTISLKVSNANPEVNEEITIYADVMNVGSEDINESFTVRFYYDSIEIYNEIINGLTSQSVEHISFSYTPTSTGQHVIKGVVDADGAIVEDNENNNVSSKTISVSEPANNPPVAAFTYTPATPLVGDIITFNASSSYDPDGDKITDYIWDFGDGDTATGVVTTHSYSSPGTYDVTLTVYDERGGVNSTTVAIEVIESICELPGWDYRKAITITNQNSFSLTDYQIKIELNSSNFDFTKANSDGSDIRFTESDGSTFLNYWIESWDPSNQTATIWVKVNIPASTSKTIYMYYGNSSATSMSNGDSTFVFFDDFEGTSLNTTKWATNTDTYQVENGAIRLWGSWNDGAYLNTRDSFSGSFVVEGRWRLSTTSKDVDLAVVFAEYSNSYMWESTSITCTYDSQSTSRPYYQKDLNVKGTHVDWGPEIESSDWQKFRIIFTQSYINYWDSWSAENSAKPSLEYSGSTFSTFYLGIAADSDSTSRYGYIDYIFMRKYVENEPSVVISATETDCTVPSPTADFTFTPSTPQVNEEITFNASSSTPSEPGGSITNYHWDFGDGNVIDTTSPTITHTYSSANTYSVTLTVTDSLGRQDSVTKQVEVLEASVCELPGWDYRKAITITNQNSFSLTDYQIKIELNSSNFDFTKANSDGSDIRFTESDGSTFLNYWIESWDPSNQTATIWVKVNIPASTSKTIYMYYGNSSATSMSNPEKTMFLYENFESDPGNLYGDAYYDSANRYVVLTRPLIFQTGYMVYNSVPTNPTGFYAKFYFKSGGGRGADALWMGAYDTDYTGTREDIVDGGYHFTYDEYNDRIAFTKSTTDNGAPIAYYSIDGSQIANLEWHLAEIYFWYDGKANTRIYLDGSEVASSSDTNPQINVINGVGKIIFGGRTGALTNYHIIGNGLLYIAKYTPNVGYTIEDADTQCLPSPTADFTFTPSTPQVNEEITFNASSSTPSEPGGSITNYHWDFGDGNVIDTTSPTITHTYSSANTYSVTLTVTDSLGRQDSVTKQVEVSETLFDPGFAYEDVNGNLMYDPGVDVQILASEIQDGVYDAGSNGLVIPPSVGDITASSIYFKGRDVVVSVDLTASKGVEIIGSDSVDITGVSVSSTNYNRDVVIQAGKILANGTDITAHGEVFLKATNIYISDSTIDTSSEYNMKISIDATNYVFANNATLKSQAKIDLGGNSLSGDGMSIDNSKAYDMKVNIVFLEDISLNNANIVSQGVVTINAGTQLTASDIKIDNTKAYNKKVEIYSSGDLNITGGEIRSKGNVLIQTYGGDLIANAIHVDSSGAYSKDITFKAENDIYLNSSKLVTNKGDLKAKVTGSPASQRTVYVDQAEFYDKDNKLEVSPKSVKVVGTPKHGGIKYK